MSVKADYKVTFLQKELPPIQVEDKKIEINFSLTLPEVICLSFYIDAINSAVDTGEGFAFVGVEEKLQGRFIEFVEKTFKNRAFSPAELKLDSLVTSIWQKSRIFTQGQCILLNNLEELADEKQWQDQTFISSLYFNLKGCDGKWFTARQLNLCKNSLDDIAKTAAFNKV